MSSVQKGNDFETRVFRAIERSLTRKKLGLLPSACRLYRDRGYFSRDRNGQIRVDISIEVWLPNADTWSLLWVWECKNYEKSVPVDDVEEFWAKLQQIAGANVKGAIVSSRPLQRGAIEFAQSKGIAVVTLLPAGALGFSFYNRLGGARGEVTSTTKDLNAGISSPESAKHLVAELLDNLINLNWFFEASYNGEAFSDWGELLLAVISSNTDTV